MTSQEPEPTRKQLQAALVAAQARLESPRERSAQVSGTGAIEGDFAEAPAGSPALLDEIATLERALNDSTTSDHNEPADVKH